MIRLIDFVYDDSSLLYTYKCINFLAVIILIQKANKNIFLKIKVNQRCFLIFRILKIFQY